MSNDVSSFLDGYAVVPRTTKLGGPLTDRDVDESIVEEIEAEVARERSSIAQDDREVPEGAFLVSTAVGDIYYHPDGFLDESLFIVLFFNDADKLYFVPKAGTRLATMFDVEDKRYAYDLYFSGIKFELDDRLVVIFHKYANEY